MGDVLPWKKKTLRQRHKGNTLCRNGHHKWRIDKAKQFDVQAGKLVTVYECERCAKRKVKAH